MSGPEINEAELPVLFRPIKQSRFRGGKNLKTIQPRHQKVISLYISGYKKMDIAELAGYSYDQITNILGSPIVQSYLAAEFDRNTDDLKALMPLAVDAMRKTLMFDHGKIRLTAADMVLKTQGAYKDDPKARETAEDVIARALDIMKDQSGAIRDLTRSQDPSSVPPAEIAPNGSSRSPHTIDVEHEDV